MKQFSIFIFLFLTTINFTKAQISYIKSLGTPGNDKGNTIVKAADGGYVTAGYTDYFTGTKDIYIVKTDFLGELQWSKTIGNSNHQRVRKIIKDERDGYIITGMTTNGSNPDQAFVMRLDDTGRLDWHLFVEDTVSLAFYGITETKSGHFIAVGHRKTKADSTDVFISKISNSGNLIQSKAYIHSGSQEAFNIIEDENGDLVATGWYKNASQFNNLNRLMVVKTDSNLNSLNNYIIHVSKGSSFGSIDSETYGYDLIYGSDRFGKRYFVTGWVNEKNNNNNPLGDKMFVMALDTGFNASGYTNYGKWTNPMYQFGTGRSYDIKKTVSGTDYYISGTTRKDSAGNRHPKLLRVNINQGDPNDGVLKFSTELKKNNPDSMAPTEIIPESGDISTLLSTTIESNTYNFSIAKSNSNGIFPCHSSKTESNSKVTSFDYLTFKIILTSISTGSISSMQLSDSFRHSTTAITCCKITAPVINDFKICESQKGTNIPLRRSVLIEGVNYEFYVDDVFYSSDPEVALFIDSDFNSVEIKIRLIPQDSLCTPDSVSYTIGLNIFEKHVFDSVGCLGYTFVYKAPDLASTNSIKWAGTVKDTSGRTFKINYSDSVFLNYTLLGCPFQDTFAVTINPLPVFSISDTSFCPGNSVTVSAPDNMQYNWMNGLYNTQEIFLTDSGTYWVKVTDSNQCVYSDTFNAKHFPTPTPFNLGPDDSICSNAKKWLYTPYTQFGVTYEWNYGEHYGIQFYADPGRMHVFRIINSDGCFAADSLFLGAKLAPETGFNDSMEFCYEEILYTNTYHNAQYRWNGNFGSDSFIFTGQNPLILEINLPNGCSTKDTITTTTKPDPEFSLGADTVICAGDSLILEGPLGMTEYLWNDFSTAQFYTVTSPGLYSLWVKAPNGCSFEDEIMVDTQTCGIGLKEIALQKFNIYPNPAGKYVMIQNSGQKMDARQQLRIMSMEGKTVFESLIKLQSGETFKIDVGHLPSGLYFVHLGNNIQRIAVMRE